MSLEDINYKAERLDDKHFKIKFKTGDGTKNFKLIIYALLPIKNFKNKTYKQKKLRNAASYIY